MQCDVLSFERVARNNRKILKYYCIVLGTFLVDLLFISIVPFYDFAYCMPDPLCFAVGRNCSKVLPEIRNGFCTSFRRSHTLEKIVHTQIVPRERPYNWLMQLQNFSYRCPYQQKTWCEALYSDHLTSKFELKRQSYTS